ncbi:hypothetical protein TBLA_0G01940 [Henningerozyma blattae CBS 6284]|uniref:Transcriptional coactivator p15 (PC4) C-terminal domain-containing protein n=1 Tax=Henningerozyma blattae (strain ATCC 34711 / CBS 6284 / DSM 70876 / NBRC 10599 / NRRL Y-10934 / UCD 77-7) TaxID=1071380 RepID=I2H6Y4_HENB6|nr:hypothetical protein TBLA_0G01940 [Tetrapisispora blattae CBS 6284]CCH62136.1 hypothetical protein TBLA_0G01940 [Tetrapisispora blattae CBS 6284]
MSYYNRYRNKKRGGDSNNSSASRNAGASHTSNQSNMSQLSQGGLGAPDAIFDLGKNKRVTVRQFRNMNLIDIREYYMDSSTGEMRPGKKGISLTEDLYDELLKHRLNIDEALRRLGSKRPRTRTIVLNHDDDDDDHTATFNNEKENKEPKDGSKRIRDSDDKDDVEINKKSKRESSNKKQVAPPTLTNSEEKKQNLEREANATLFLPVLSKPSSSTPTPPASVLNPVPPPVTATNAIGSADSTSIKTEMTPEVGLSNTNYNPITNTVTTSQPASSTAANNTNAHDDNSSDEEFAKHLEAEMNRADDDISEEE